MITGTGRSAWIRRQTSRPSYPGSITSRTTRSGSCSPYDSTAPGPSYVRTTSYPSATSRSATAWLITGSSSTTRIRRLALLMVEGYERERWEIGTTCGGSVQVSLAASNSGRAPTTWRAGNLLRTPCRNTWGVFDVRASPHRPGAVTAQEIPMTTSQLPRTAYAPVRQADPRPALRRVAGGSVVAALAGAIVLFAYGAAVVAIHGPMQ